MIPEPIPEPTRSELLEAIQNKFLNDGLDASYMSNKEIAEVVVQVIEARMEQVGTDYQVGWWCLVSQTFQKVQFCQEQPRQLHQPVFTVLTCQEDKAMSRDGEED